MKLLKLLIVLVLFSSVLIAEDKEEKKDTLWTPNGMIGLNLSQISLSNWTQGGDNSISFTFFSVLGIDYIGNPWNWTNTLKLTYGRSRVGDAEYRTNENEIYFETVLSHKVEWIFDPYASGTFRTALTKGFDYSVDPKIQIVDFFDPAYFTEGLGLQYKTDVFIQRLGLSAKQTVADRFSSLYSDDPDTPNEIESFKFEGGFESVSEIKYEFLENMVYLGYLRLFTRFDDFSLWDVRWDNIITAQVNKYVNVNISFLLIYDESQSIKRQIKQALQLGVTYSLF